VYVLALVVVSVVVFDLQCRVLLYSHAAVSAAILPPLLQLSEAQKLSPGSQKK
jgi:hypothetical protein